MPALTCYLIDSLAAGSNHLDDTDTGPGATASFNPVTGWTVGTTAATRYSAMDSQTKRAATTFGTTALPAAAVPDNTLGDSWRLGPYDGVFDAGTWTFTFVVRGVTRASDTQRGRVRVRVYRGTDPTGAGATEITTGNYTPSGGASTAGRPMLTSITPAAITSGADQTVSFTWAAPQLTLAGEYLFLKVAWEITTAGNNNGSDLTFREGTTATRVATANFTQTAVPANITAVESAAVGEASKVVTAPQLAVAYSAAAAESATAVVSPVLIDPADAVVAGTTVAVTLAPPEVIAASPATATETAATRAPAGTTAAGAAAGGSSSNVTTPARLVGSSAAAGGQDAQPNVTARVSATSDAAAANSTGVSVPGPAILDVTGAAAAQSAGSVRAIAQLAGTSTAAAAGAAGATVTSTVEASSTADAGTTGRLELPVTIAATSDASATSTGIITFTTGSPEPAPSTSMRPGRVVQPPRGWIARSPRPGRIT